MIDGIAAALVLSTALYLLALGLMALAAPARAAAFLERFASSAFAHYLEAAIRLAVGGAFVVHAEKMLHGGVFLAFGWILVATTVGLLLVPWRWHHRFAQWSVPLAVRRYLRIQPPLRPEP